MNAIQAAVKSVTDLLALGDYRSVENLTGGQRLSAGELAGAVADYGQTLAPLPTEALADIEVTPVADSTPPRFFVDVDLWTAAEGRSDLTLTLELTDRYGGAYAVAVVDLRMQ